MSVDSKMLTNTQNTFQNTSSNSRCGSQNGGKKRLRKNKRSRRNKRNRKNKRRNQKGGNGSGVTFDSLNADAHSGAGLARASTVQYENCGGKMSGGGELMNKLNHAGPGSYGYDAQGAQLTGLVRGSYPVYSENTRSQCGGKKKSSKKSKKTSKSKKGKKSKKARKSRKNKSGCVAIFSALKIGGRRRNKRKSKKRTKRRGRRSRRRMQKGGFSQNGMHLPRTLNYSVGTDNLGSTPWATAPVSIANTGGEMVDNYNHYKGTHTPTVEQHGAVESK